MQLPKHSGDWIGIRQVILYLLMYVSMLLFNCSVLKDRVAKFKKGH